MKVSSENTLVSQASKSMISVSEAEEIINAHCMDYGTERIALDGANGRILSEPLIADRDLPPYNRVTMDGIAIKFEAIEKGIRSFKITGIQAAGDYQNINSADECIEIMTGAALLETTDTVIRYEDIIINNGIAQLTDVAVRKSQNIHFRGADSKKGSVVAAAYQRVNPAVISVASSIGATEITVKKLPKILVISTGDEVVGADQSPSPFQIRSSNKQVIRAALEFLRIKAEAIHLIDDKEIISSGLSKALKEYDVLILCGGVSKGKFDFIPESLENLGVQKHFHHVRQRPGKPFWFGSYEDSKIIFALPGNPSAVFVCLYRYIIPWLNKSLGIINKKTDAVLTEKISFNPQLQYFVPVKLQVEEGRIMATPIKNNGSGDFVNLVHADGFMELSEKKEIFEEGEVNPVWLINNII